MSGKGSKSILVILLMLVVCSAFQLRNGVKVLTIRSEKFRNLCSRPQRQFGQALKVRATAESKSSGQQSGMISEASNAKMSKEDRITLWADVEQLETNLQEAIDLEDYSQAAVLRDRIKKLKLLDPYTSAKDKMDKAIAAEQYEEAAMWKNSMAEVGEPPQKPGKGTSLSLSGDGTAPANSDGVSSSDITTLGVRVQV
jgi:hypothetical protein